MNPSQIKHVCRVLDQLATWLMLVVALINLYLYKTGNTMEIGLLTVVLGVFALAQVTIFKLLGRISDDKPDPAIPLSHIQQHLASRYRRSLKTRQKTTNGRSVT